MEELNKKLLSKDNTVIALVISKIVEHIQKEDGKEELLEPSFLIAKSVNPDPKINEVVSLGIIKLLENKIINPDQLLEEFITLIPSSNKISRGITKAISGVLCYQLLNDHEHFSAKFNLFMPQHPFVTLLIKDPECLSYIYNEIRYTDRAKDWCIFWNALNYPFYQFCICNPSNKKPNFYKMKLWLNLLETSKDTKLITKLISWMLFDSTGSILITSELMNELTLFCWRNEDKINIQVLLLLQVSVLYHLVSNGYDPRSTLENIELLISKMPIVHFTNAVLLILVKVIIRASSVHVLVILQICELLIRQPNINFFVLESVKVSMLHWIGNPSALSTEIVSKAGEIYFFIQDQLSKEKAPNNEFHTLHKKYSDLIVSNQEICIACKLSDLCESWRNGDAVIDFLKKLKNLGVNFIRRVIHLVFGLFVCDLNDTRITLAAFEIICVYIEQFKKFSHLVLTLILYKLSNSKDSNVHFNLLKYLPKLATANENYLKVITTIKVLFSGSDYALKTFAMSIMYDLWKIDPKAYPYLEDMLTSAETVDSCQEYYINKAFIIKQLCENNPKVYGEEMVAHLSRILSKCSGFEGDLASSISLDAITVLCREGITDIETTWTTLAPKFIKDKRIQTTKSLCGLVAAMPDLLHAEQHAKLQKEVISKMWDYVLENQDLEIKKAALNALAEFGLENISPHFPEQYLSEVSEVKVDGKPLLVQGHCWIAFLKNQSDLNAGGDFLIRMMNKEIEEYLKSTYQVTTLKEPTNYSYLPTHSIVRGIAEHCKMQSPKWRDFYKPVYIQCMRILSQKYCRPLPPYSWNFLNTLVHEPELKTYCISLASLQVMISGTARKFIENHIVGLANNFKNVEGVLLIYKNLKFMANSIQPIILGPFFTNTINYGKYLLKEQHNKEFLTSIVTSLRDVLVDPNIQEANKKGIVTVINEQIETVDTSDQVFEIFLDCMVDYPTSLLRITLELVPTEQMTANLFEKAMRIRCFLALRPNETLKWLNDLIDFCTIKPQFGCCLKNFLNVFEQQKNHTECARWTTDLLGRIEAAIGNPCNKESLLFLLDILVTALVVFSGFHVFLSSTFEFGEYLALLPQATALLTESEEWNSFSEKAMEFFYHLNMSKKLLPNVYQNIFGQTLQALRHHREFKKNNKWMKYLNSNIILSTNL